eukprot:TRINITY_DN12086_c0_g1_i1.p1 TRINITY_DN12086_c0_g1~~TRINITY_DN12086_c0_g1_i1.p1  ORF type:complete len:348 (+),score=72.77 TRINITY_DN12086_c0_g1_i1:144-1187(+)
MLTSHGAFLRGWVPILYQETVTKHGLLCHQGNETCSLVLRTINSDCTMATSNAAESTKSVKEPFDGLMAGTPVNEDEKEVLNVSFEAVQPNQDDFWGMRTLFRQTFVRSDINYGAISDFIISNPTTATAIKVADQSDGNLQPAKKPKRQSDGDDGNAEKGQQEDDKYNVYGLVTAMPTKHADTKAIVKEIKTWMAGHINDMAFKTELATAMKDTSTIMVFAERFVNLPPQIAVGLYQALADDIAAAVREKSLPAVKSVILITKGWKPKGEEAKSGSDELNMTCPEDEYFREVAKSIADFEIKPPSDDDDNYPVRTFRSVVLMDYKHFDSTCRLLGQTFATVFDKEDD